MHVAPRINATTIVVATGHISMYILCILTDEASTRRIAHYDLGCDDACIDLLVFCLFVCIEYCLLIVYTTSFHAHPLVDIVRMQSADHDHARRRPLQALLS